MLTHFHGIHILRAFSLSSSRRCWTFHNGFFTVSFRASCRKLNMHMNLRNCAHRCMTWSARLPPVQGLCIAPPMKVLPKIGCGSNHILILGRGESPLTNSRPIILFISARLKGSQSLYWVPPKPTPSAAARAFVVSTMHLLTNSGEICVSKKFFGRQSRISSGSSFRAAGEIPPFSDTARSGDLDANSGRRILSSSLQQY